MLKLVEPLIAAFAPHPAYMSQLAALAHHFVTLDSAGRVKPLTSVEEELGLLFVLIQPPRTGEGCVCAFGGIVDVVAAAPLPVGVEVVADYELHAPGRAAPKPGDSGFYMIRGQVVMGAAALNDTAKILLTTYMH
jgi:hypothetical protein